MNALLDWMIRGCLCLLEITLCMRLRAKGKCPGIARMGSPRGLVFSHGVARSSPIETVEVEYLKFSPHHTRRRLFQAVIRDSNQSVSETGGESRPNYKRES
ncbi:MAG: hypothetical protein PGMFKBFP_00410 [Anaerolineales bacterium]|nr:hypothetical protein [Anaerolineales bacterium]